MKVKVISTFRDKNTLKVNKVGKVLDISEDRYQELKDFVKPEAETKKGKQKK